MVRFCVVVCATNDVMLCLCWCGVVKVVLLWHQVSCRCARTLHNVMFVRLTWIVMKYARAHGHAPTGDANSEDQEHTGTSVQLSEAENADILR